MNECAKSCSHLLKKRERTNHKENEGDTKINADANRKKQWIKQCNEVKQFERRRRRIYVVLFKLLVLLLLVL